MNQADKILANRYYHTPAFWKVWEEMVWQYFLVLSRLLAVTILCVGFAVITQWRIEALRPKPLLKGQTNHLQNRQNSSLLSLLKNKTMRTRIFAVVFTLAICVPFFNYMSQEDELGYLQNSIKSASESLVYNQYASDPIFLAKLETMKFQFFVALSRLFVVSILCAGFAIMTQWKIETTLQPKPLLTEQSSKKQRNTLRLIKNKLLFNIHRTSHNT